MLAISLFVFLSIACIVFLTSIAKLNAFVSLFVVSLFLALVALPDKNIVEILKQGFGNTMASIGFLIIPGAIIAIVLEKTGAAISIANYIISKTGKHNGAMAMGITGFVAGLPIFCDAGFIILSGLAKSVSKRTKISMTLIAFVLATSLYSVHCLTPTHPGALAAAGILNANIGQLIIWGILLAIPASIAAYFWINWKSNKNTSIEEDLQEDIALPKKEETLPPVFLSLLPVIFPLLLIALGALVKTFSITGDTVWVKIIFFISNPVIALCMGAVLAFLLVKKISIQTLNPLFESAIEKAGPILIVTAAGGMFGLVIKETGVGLYVGELLVKTGLGIVVPYLITSILKTAQGSSTVAMITASSFVAPMLSLLGLDTETGKLLTLLSMGAGSMMISHANDSYFWVVSRFSGIPMSTTLKVYSTATIIMSVTVFICVYIASLFIL